MTGSLRLIRPLSLPNLYQAQGAGACPVVEHVDPATLWVDEEYQRNLSKRSIALLKKIVSEWDWRKFKPPVTEALLVGGVRQLHVIDGQHTAIGAATRNDILMIPVLINDGSSLVEDRARAFVGHNVDRIAVTANQIFYAELAANDEVAVRIHKLCQETGVTILKHLKLNYDVGDTVALAVLRSFAKTMTDDQIGPILRILVQAGLRPIPSDAFKAVRTLLWDPRQADSPDISVLRLVVKNLGEDAIAQAKVAKATRGYRSVHLALTAIYARECRRVLAA